MLFANRWRRHSEIRGARGDRQVVTTKTRLNASRRSRRQSFTI
jgi:hypothetical protein